MKNYFCWSIHLVPPAIPSKTIFYNSRRQWWLWALIIDKALHNRVFHKHTKLTILESLWKKSLMIESVISSCFYPAGLPETLWIHILVSYMTLLIHRFTWGFRYKFMSRGWMCQGVDYRLKLKERPISWKSYFEMLIFTIFTNFVYFSCISDRNLFIL